MQFMAAGREVLDKGVAKSKVRAGARVGSLAFRALTF